MEKAFEVNFDGLVGPTHNYSGLSHGNVASTSNKATESNPLQAVLEGLSKMKFLVDRGFHQGIFPPHERPHIDTLRNLGFSGSDKRILEETAKKAPELISAVSSASAMWTANAATVSPSADTKDKKVHFTPANLVSKFHRWIESPTTSAILKKTFKNPKYFSHHNALPSVPALGDEGAANHTRLCAEYSEAGVEFFVYGRQGLHGQGIEPKVFPARQTREASITVSQVHGLNPSATVFAQQNPKAIDAGVFHNDVVGVGNKNFYFFHEEAYVNTSQVVDELTEKVERICKTSLKVRQVRAKDISLDQAVRSYLFNSQLLARPDGQMILLAPSECEDIPSIKNYVENLIEDPSLPLREVHFFPLRQSMRNGGGPACLRLRVVLTEKQLAATNPRSLLTEKNYTQLVSWAKKNYRDRLTLDDLRDPKLMNESRRALDQLTQILGLGSLYSFQKN